MNGFPKHIHYTYAFGNVVIPFKCQPEHYHMMVPRIATLYEPTYVINENEGVLVNGNSGILKMCYRFATAFRKYSAFLVHLRMNWCLKGNHGTRQRISEHSCVVSSCHTP